MPCRMSSLQGISGIHGCSIFSTSTPELELSGLTSGLAKTNKVVSESLRAIPGYSPGRNRLNLPAWLGRQALNKVMQEKQLPLNEMYQSWTWFQTLVDLLEMILAKSDKRIAENDQQLLETSRMGMVKNSDQLQAATDSVFLFRATSSWQHNPVPKFGGTQPVHRSFEYNTSGAFEAVRRLGADENA